MQKSSKLKPMHRVSLDICAGFHCILTIYTLVFCIISCIKVDLGALLILPIGSAPFLAITYYSFWFGRKIISPIISEATFLLGFFYCLILALITYFRLHVGLNISQYQTGKIESIIFLAVIVLFLFSSIILIKTASIAIKMSKRA